MEQPLPPLDMLQTRIISYTEIGQVLINLIVSNANTIVDSNYLLKAMFNDNIEVKKYAAIKWCCSRSINE